MIFDNQKVKVLQKSYFYCTSFFLKGSYAPKKIMILHDMVLHHINFFNAIYSIDL
jgi:hypothetical protein